MSLHTRWFRGQNATGLAQLQPMVHDRARILTSADGSALVLAKDNECFYLDEDEYVDGWLGHRASPADSLAGWALLHDESAIVVDVATDPRISPQARALGLAGSLVMIPVCAPTGQVAAITTWWALPGRATADHLRALGPLAAEISALLLAKPSSRSEVDAQRLAGRRTAACLEPDPPIQDPETWP